VHSFACANVFVRSYPDGTLYASQAGRGATVLIHEATFDDSPEMMREAMAKRHSTSLEAMDVGRRYVIAN